MTGPYVPQKTARAERIALRGVEHHISLWGATDKPLLFYLHGWGDTGSTFQFVVDSLSERWCVVAPDWRGFGKSEHPAQGYWFPDYLADLHALLAHYTPNAPARLVGHSMGANVAGLYAGVMPERVSAFVNVEGFGLADSEPGNAPATYRRWIEAEQAARPFSVYRDVGELVPRILKRSPRMPPDKALFVAREWSTVAADGSVCLRADPAHRLPNPVQYRRAEAEACWNRVQARVLLVLGEQTDFTSAAQSWIDPDETRHPFRQAHTQRIADAGHMVHFEAPAALAGCIDDFFPDL